MRALTLIAIALALLPSPCAAGGVKSIYTTIDLARCKVAATGESFITWGCPGTENGFDLVISEDNGRFFVSFGKPAKESRASTQKLKAVNSLFESKDASATVEWRLERKGSRWVPFATILRYYTRSDASVPALEGQVLVVSKVGGGDGGDSCHVAYVDALANADGNEIAVRAADQLAAAFDCSKEPVVIGKAGKSPM